MVTASDLRPSSAASAFMAALSIASPGLWAVILLRSASRAAAYCRNISAATSDCVHRWLNVEEGPCTLTNTSRPSSVNRSQGSNGVWPASSMPGSVGLTV